MSSCKTSTVYTSTVLTTYTSSYTSALTTVTPPPTTTTYTTSTCPVSTYYSYYTGSDYTSSSAYATSSYYSCTPQYITTSVYGTPYTTYTTIPTTYYQTTTIPTYYPTTTCEYVYPTTSVYETLGRRTDMEDSGYVSPISSKCLSFAVLFGGLVFAVVLISLVYHLLFKKWVKNKGTFCATGTRLHYDALLLDEKGFKYEGHYLPHAGSTEHGVESCMPYDDMRGPLDKEGLGKKIIAKEPISPSVYQD